MGVLLRCPPPDGSEALRGGTVASAEGVGLFAVYQSIDAERRAVSHARCQHVGSDATAGAMFCFSEAGGLREDVLRPGP